MQRSYKGFYARMLGGFVLYFQSQELTIPMRLQAKAMQLMLQLIKAGGDGIERKELVDTFQRDCYDWERQINNFRQQVYILRHAIQNAGFPPGNYIVSKGSRYYFTLDYQVETDTGRLDQLLPCIQNRTEEDPGKTRELLMEFCRTYTGEFLPMLNGEEWVNMESAYYQNWYFKCLKQLCQILKQEGSYEEMLELCTAASQMHPYDEWQKMQIDCLMSMNRYQEAMKIYEEAAQMFYDELGISVNDQALSRYRSASGQFYYAANALVNVMDRLREHGEVQGPYCCSYPSFLDIYHVISRLEERTGMKNLLMICTMDVTEMTQNEKRQRKPENPEKTEEQQNWERSEPEMELFRQVLAGGIRSGDVYTRYSANQFLVLLVGADQEDGPIIISRLENRWKGIQKGRAAVSFAVYTVESSVMKGDRNESGNERNLYDTYH